MAINLSNVNISLRQFQEISSGKYNAGEVKLTSETEIDKVNNHVTMKFLNSTKISHMEVVAIKNAFVKALKSGGVNGDELNRIRQELGLSPMKPVDKTLHERSIKPLSRQQIREILDRNANAINEQLGNGTIRTSAQIHAGVSEQTLASRADDRNKANTELNTRRDVIENKAIYNLQSVLAGDVDFTSANDRKELLAMARRCLDAVLVDCNASPRDNFRPVIHWTSPGGTDLAFPTGLTEKALVRKLEDIIVRLAIDDRSPSRDKLAFRDEFKALATPEARVAWAANLMDDPAGARKARTVAVMIMHDRGIDDAATLSIVNKLKTADAIAFVANLVTGGMNLEGDELRRSAPVQTAMACADMELELTDLESAYIPALTVEEFNDQIATNMKMHPERLPATFLKLVSDAAFEVRSHFGAAGYPDDATPSMLTRGVRLSDMVGVGNPNAPRVTPEALRGAYIQEALGACAERALQEGVRTRLKDAGLNVKNPIRVANAMSAREPAIIQRMLAAPTPKEADDVLNDYKELMEKCAREQLACDSCQKSLPDRVRAALGEKLGVPAASLLGKGVLDIGKLRKQGLAFMDAIGNGTKEVASAAEIEAEYRKLVDNYVNERVEILSKIDKSDLPEEAKVEFKKTSLSIGSFKYLDIDAMVASVKEISTTNLTGFLADNAPKERIFEAMDDISTAVTNAMNEMFEAARKAGKDIGAEEKGDFIDAMIRMVVLSKPGLADLLAQFLSSPAMANENVYQLGVHHPAANFMAFKPVPGANAELASKLGTDAFPSFHTLALMEALREEGLGELTAAETLALFKPGQPTGGGLLKAAILNSDRDVTPTMLKNFARNAIRMCRQAIDSMLENKAAVEAAERSFLAGNGAASALAAGYHKSELPRLAKAFALYKVAMGVSDAAALSAVRDPASKVSRLMSYGGRFMESAEDFRAGLILMDRFAEWYANLADGARSEHPDTLSKVNASAGSTRPEAVKAYELFVFQDLAIRPDVNLNADPETLFGIEHNDVVNFFSRANGVSYIATFVKLPPAKRQVLFAAFKAIEPPRPENPDHSLTDVNDHAGYIARILRHYDEVAELMAAGNLDRTHLNQILTPDLDLPPDATSKQVREAIQARVYAKYANSFEKIMEVSTLMGYTGCTVTEALEAVETGKKPANLPDIASTTMRIENIDGTTNAGREMMLGDLCRPSNPSYVGGRQSILSDDENHFVVKIGGETIKCIRSGNPDVNAPIADKIENLCGKVHVEQANTVMRGLAQGAHLPLLSILPHHGISGGEHMPLTYTIAKNDETGAVTIRYSEPKGFPFKFSWETTVALDGTSTTTPVIVEPAA